MPQNISRTAKLAAGLAVATLALSACGGGGGGDDDTASAGSGDDSASGGTVTLGIIPSWTDGLSTAYLWEHVLEEKGYDVEMQKINDAAPLYAGLAQGDVDVYPSAWPEVTHAQYMDEYGDDIEDIGTWYEGAKLTMAVPEYTDISSIEDLKGAEDRFDGRIVGIEPGAGLTKATKESVIPGYGLEDYTFQTSSTTAMLAELKSATEAEEDIVVTLWRPFWANSAFPVKDLEDPQGALGEAEGLHELARTGFGEDMPEVAAMMANFTLTDAQYGELEDMVVNEYGEGKEAEAVDAFFEKNPDVMTSIEG